MKRNLSWLLCLVLLITSIYIPSTTSNAADYTELAVDIAFNSDWSQEYWITKTETEQYFRLSVLTDGEITFKTMSYLSKLTWTLYTQDLSSQINSTTIIEGSENSPKTNTSTLALSAGTYYVKISQHESATGKYKVNASFTSFNANDAGANTFDSPLVLPAATTINGALTYTDAEDWYRISIVTPGTYIIKSFSYIDTLHLGLYSSDLAKKIIEKTINNGSVATPVNNSYYVSLSPGTYYIKIYKHNNFTGRYTLSWDAVTQMNCGHKYKKTTVDATYFSSGYTQYDCEYCKHSYTSDVTTQKILGQVSYISLTARPRKIAISYLVVYNATGYQIRYSTNKKMISGVKVVTANKSGSSAKVLKKLKKGKKYYVQVRALHKENGRTIYGKWSKKVSAKTK